MPAIDETRDLTAKEYARIRDLVYAESGINLGDQKMQLVRARLGKFVRNGGFSSYDAYLDTVQADSTGEQLCGLLDAISTNTTHLFREMHHFDLLGKIIGGWVQDPRWRAAHPTLRIWSAASSSGEEPHSIAMVAHDSLRAHSEIELKILATDISGKMLKRAQIAIYDPHRLGTTPPQYRNRYLCKVDHQGTPMMQLSAELRGLITFARFNLMNASFPFRHGFDVVFCRNVMIYFDRQTQEALVNKIAGQLHPGGYLLIGHSESLNRIDHSLEYVEPTVYRRKG
ncbi:MAG: methyltransferase domain-containing protein [bacterium]|nr:methyltransferase domain-containing protein [bacterium]